MTKKQLDIWYRYIKAIKNGDYLEREDKQELIRLNHLVMEASHEVHNDHMLKDEPDNAEFNRTHTIKEIKEARQAVKDSNGFA